MSEIANRVVNDYIFNWGQSRDVRVKTLNDAIKAAGIKATAYVDKTGTMFFDSEDLTEMRRAVMFRTDIHGHLGSDNESKVDAVIAKYRDRRD